MKSVIVSLPHHKYSIQIGSGLFESSIESNDAQKNKVSIGTVLFYIAPHYKVCVISDSNVAPLYFSKLSENLKSSGYKQVISYVLPAGEEHKTLDQVSMIYDFLVEENVERTTPIIALGGGVVGDTVGFAASTFLRGLPFMQLPTTLLSMIDASIGGKVGVNLVQGKNLIGSFYQPQVVMADVSCLDTLCKREFCSGMAESVKHAILSGHSFMSWLEKHRDDILGRVPQVLEELVEKNVLLKAGIVMADERENGQRAWLNLGHTFAHAIEVTTGYSLISHGEAVSLGLVAASVLSAKRGLWSTECVHRVETLLSSFGLPVRAELKSEEDLLAAMMHDKKVAKHRLRFVLPMATSSESFGTVDIFDDVSKEEIVSAFKYLRS